MGREINLEAGNRLNLRDAVALSHSYFLMLKAAFEQRLGEVGGVAVMLDSMVEIATEAGYKGTLDQATSILKVEDGFVVEPSPSGRRTARRLGFPANSNGEKSAQDYLEQICPTVKCPERCSPIPLPSTAARCIWRIPPLGHNRAEVGLQASQYLRAGRHPWNKWPARRDRL